MGARPEKHVAAFGSIFSGSLLLADMLEGLSCELSFCLRASRDYYAVPENHAEGDRLRLLVDEARGLLEYRGEDGWTTTDSNEAEAVLEELHNELNGFVPHGAYFGAHPGDGADFGYWLDECFVEDFDGLKVTDTSEVPATYKGLVLHVNERGNMTLFRAGPKFGQLEELWGLV